MKARKGKTLIGDIIGVLLAVMVFLLPFYFMVINSLKTQKEASTLDISPPEVLQWGNYREVFEHANYQMLTAFKNSGLLALFSVGVLVLVCSMAGYVLQRRSDSRAYRSINSLFLTGLMVPAAIMPTIWLLQALGLFKSLFGMVLIEVALQIPFTILLYRGFMSSIPVELEEAACIDGCSTFQMFFRIIFPILKPITSTVVILNAITVFNDFTNPLYFWPGINNATVQLTLFNYKGQFSSSYNLLFANVLLITLPMFILYLFFSKRIVSGMVAGSVKG